MRHLIKKQIIELSLDRSLNHYHVQQQVSERYWKEILPMLEKAFDAISKEDELIEIDHFELDLGVVSVKEIEEESWGFEIKKKIQEKIAAITDPASSKYAIKSRDRRLGVFGQWLFYMDHGFLSWKTTKPDENWYRDVLEAIAVDIRSHETLQQRIREQPFFIQRMVNQHPDSFLHKLSEVLTAKKQDGLSEAIDELLLLYHYLRNRKKISATKTDREFKNDRWQWILESAAGKRILEAEQNLVTSLARYFVNEFSLTTKIPTTIAEKIPNILPALRKFSEELKIIHQTEKKILNKLVQDIQDSTITKKIDQGKLQEDETEDLSRYNSRLIDSEGIFIVHAGTILVHPFLRSLFNRLGLLNENQFTSRQHQVNAVGLVHWLATGRSIAQEYELALPKVLCGFSLEEPIVLPETFPPEFLQEANDLLEAAIAQWSILKNTSIEGLREGFLQRPGKLFSKNGNLWLQVEKNSIDVLLDYLPWNLGVIKLPWIKDMLRVEWR